MRSLLFVSLLCVVNIGFGEEKPALKIGDEAPDWKPMLSTDGRMVSLKNFAEFDVIVLCFTCNTCPYSVDYEDRMIEFQSRMKEAGRVQLIAVNSNANSGDSAEKMKARAAAKKFNFPYLKDESQDVARAYGAIYTPEFFVLNGDRKLIYKGAMDDATKPEEATVNYVTKAAEAALTEKTPEVTSAGARGCAIRFRRKRR